jgi:hypothetical protein
MFVDVPNVLAVSIIGAITDLGYTVRTFGSLKRLGISCIAE